MFLNFQCPPLSVSAPVSLSCFLYFLLSFHRSFLPSIYLSFLFYVSSSFLCFVASNAKHDKNESKRFLSKSLCHASSLASFFFGPFLTKIMLDFKSTVESVFQHFSRSISIVVIIWAKLIVIIWPKFVQ